MFADIKGEFCRLRFDDAPRRHIAALRPVVRIGAGTSPGSEKSTIPGHTISAAHEHRIGNTGLVVILEFLALGDEAFRKCQIQMLSARTRQGGAGVKVLARW